jgi:hypothetical protein
MSGLLSGTRRFGQSYSNLRQSSQLLPSLPMWQGQGPHLNSALAPGASPPLSQRGVRVHGIELSAAMVVQLHAQDEGLTIGVTIGDFATTKVDKPFRLVCLLRNTITNLITQDEQVAAFCNAAKHLQPGGQFVIENYVPELRRLPPGEITHVFAATPSHLGFENYDVVNQIAVSHHCWVIEGQLKQFFLATALCVACRARPHGTTRGTVPGGAMAGGIANHSPARARTTSRFGRRLRSRPGQLPHRR